MLITSNISHREIEFLQIRKIPHPLYRETPIQREN